MEYRQLGQSDLKVSALGLGTMTWGEQNTQAEAFEQMDYAVAQGINLFDTAEMYPVPPRPETQGSTEAYIGNWLASRGARDDIILASKVTGRVDLNPGVAHIRTGPRLSAEQVHAAIDESLKRLKTDYVDLYQVHWPERKTNFFGRLDYTEEQDDGVDIRETMEALATIVEQGKAHYIGISNETAWGVSHYLNLAKEYNLPVIASIQNPYSLVNRTFEIGLAELCLREKVDLLAYSPLAFGVLSGKYLNGNKPAGARLTIFDRFQRYTNERASSAVGQYVELAAKHGLDPAQMALAYVTSRTFVASNLIGATTMAQLKSNIASQSVSITSELESEINRIHYGNPNPAP